MCVFYENLLTETKYNIVLVWGRDVRFYARVMNEVLGTPHCDADMFDELKDMPPYRDI